MLKLRRSEHRRKSRGLKKKKWARLGKRNELWSRGRRIFNSFPTLLRKREKRLTSCEGNTINIKLILNLKPRSNKVL